MQNMPSLPLLGLTFASGVVTGIALRRLAAWATCHAGSMEDAPLDLLAKAGKMLTSTTKGSKRWNSNTEAVRFITNPLAFERQEVNLLFDMDEECDGTARETPQEDTPPAFASGEAIKAAIQRAQRSRSGSPRHSRPATPSTPTPACSRRVSCSSSSSTHTTPLPPSVSAATETIKTNTNTSTSADCTTTAPSRIPRPPTSPFPTNPPLTPAPIMMSTTNKPSARASSTAARKQAAVAKPRWR